MLSKKLEIWRVFNSQFFSRQNREAIIYKKKKKNYMQNDVCRYS